MGGLAGTSDLVEQYARNTTRDLSHITWYTVLACFKLGIVLEGTLARASAGKAPKEVGELLHAATVQLFEQALTLMETRMIDFDIPRRTLARAARRDPRVRRASGSCRYEARSDRTVDPTRPRRWAACRAGRSWPVAPGLLTFQAPKRFGGRGASRTASRRWLVRGGRLVDAGPDGGWQLRRTRRGQHVLLGKVAATDEVKQDQRQFSAHPQRIQRPTRGRCSRMTEPGGAGSDPNQLATEVANSTGPTTSSTHVASG